MQQLVDERAIIAVADGLDTHSIADLLWLARWEHGFDLERTTMVVGVSGLFGPNNTGRDGETAILGLDVAAKWTAPGTARAEAPAVSARTRTIPMCLARRSQPATRARAAGSGWKLPQTGRMECTGPADTARRSAKRT